MEIGESSYPRRETRQIMVGDVAVGGGAPVSVQSMTVTKTADVDATLQQIYALAAAGCDIVRCTCNEPEAAEGRLERPKVEAGVEQGGKEPIMKVVERALSRVRIG